LATILQILERNEEAIQLLQQSLELNDTFYGSTSMASANVQELLTRAYFSIDDFRKALASQQIVYKFYKKHLGEEDEKTKTSAKILNTLTARAVEVAKKERSKKVSK
jgi:hypothetical protein